MRDLSAFSYWDQMSRAPVGSLCTNVISRGIVVLTQAFGCVGGKSQREQKAGVVFLAVARAGRADGEEVWQERALAAGMPSPGPRSWQWESSSAVAPSRARSQQQNHLQCHPAQPGPAGSDGGDGRGEGFAACQRWEERVGHGAWSIVAGKYILGIISIKIILKKCSF